MEITIAEGYRCKDSRRKPTMHPGLTNPKKRSSKERLMKKWNKIFPYRRKDPNDSIIFEPPPMCIIYLWLIICLSFYMPSYADVALCWIRYVSFGCILAAIFCNYFSLMYKWYRDWQYPVLDPQNGVLDIWRMDPYLKEAIQLYCLFDGIRGSKDRRAIVSNIVQYLQGHTKESLFLWAYKKFLLYRTSESWISVPDETTQVEKMIEEAFGPNKKTEKSSDNVSYDIELTQENGEYAMLSSMDQAFEDWTSFRHSRQSAKFVNFINMIVSCGLCSAHGLTFKLGNVSLFTPTVSKKQLEAGEIFEVFYEALRGFVKGGHRVFQTGEVSAFWMESEDMTNFENQFNVIRQMKGYAITGNLLQYSKEILDEIWDDNCFEQKCNEAITLGQSILRKIGKNNTFERKFVSERVEKVQDIMSEFTQLRTRGGLRISPFAVKFFGRSGCGKSTLTNLTTNAGLVFNFGKEAAAKDRIATWADNDKFASSIRSHINAIIFDDFGNTNAKFMDFSPAYRLIQVVNNIKYLAPMADVFLKGKVALSPFFCIVSTNIWHLNSSVYSNEPESILRRFYHIDVEAKPEFCESGILNRKKVEVKFGRSNKPDVWNLSIFKYEVKNSKGIDRKNMIPVYFEGKPMTDIGIDQYLKWLQVTSKDHFAEEKKVVENQTDAPDVCKKCGFCYCSCPIDEKIVLKEESGTNLSANLGTPLPRIMKPIEKGRTRLSKVYCGIRETFQERIERWLITRAECIKEFQANASTNLALASHEICEMWNRFDFLPESLICHPVIINICLFFWKEDLRNTLIIGTCLIWSNVIVMGYLCRLLFPFLCLCGVTLNYFYVCTTVQTYRRMIAERILNCKDVIKTYLNRWEVKYGLLTVACLALLGIAVYKHYGFQLEEQTGLDPQNMEEVNKRNDQVNQWEKPEIMNVPMSAKSKSTVAKDLSNAVRTNIVGIVSDKNKITLGFYVMSNFLVVPKHFVNYHEGDIKITCYKTTKAATQHVGSHFRDKISRTVTYDLPDTDFTVCYVTSGGVFGDVRHFLPESTELPAVAAMLLTREVLNPTVSTIKTKYRGTGMIRHTGMQFVGGLYKVPQGTKGGMCMSPLLSDGKGSTILGFHLGGKGDIGGCGVLTQTQVNLAIQTLAKIDSVVLTASMGDFPLETFGKPILQDQNIHAKSATRFLPEGASCEIYGSTSGRATPHSNVCPTIISNLVEKHFGVPQKWGPPKMKGPGRYPYQVTLEHAAVPSEPLGSILVRATKCVKNTTTKIKEKLPDLFDIGPLTRVQTVSGIIGKKFIDAMNFTTSPGFPLSGSKSSLLTTLDPINYPECGLPRTFTPEVWAEFDKAIEVLKIDERPYFIWKACLKDEATKLTKDKVRVFQSAPLVLQLIVRMYFLPIVRIIQMNPIAFECAVGVNAEGLDWEELWQSAMKKGKKRVLAGDYNKYDIRMPAQVTIAAFDALIDIAEKCSGYSEEDIKIMRNVVSEIVYPVEAYNGDLIQLFGTNPSGQNLTVIINSIVNSLLLRCAFYNMYPDNDFKSECSFITYGDDVIGTVSENCPLFNHISYADYLAQHDMEFTMPDKESKPTEYMEEKDVDFLKRKCVFNSDLGRHVGLLSEESIFKRLHAHLLSKELTLAEHAATNIDSSLHDWFYYGREIFEDRKSKLENVAREADIFEYCLGFDKTYDMRVNNWRHKYLGEPIDEEEICLNIQCGDMYVSTVDYGDHCRGTAWDPFFWWEHVAADLYLILTPILWWLIYMEKVDFVFCAHPINRTWIYFLCLTTGGFRMVGQIVLLVALTFIHAVVMPRLFFRMWKCWFDIIKNTFE